MKTMYTPAEAEVLRVHIVQNSYVEGEPMFLPSELFLIGCTEEEKDAYFIKYRAYMKTLAPRFSIA